VTVAVNVTFCPTTDGLGADVSVVVVAKRTTCSSTAEVLAEIVPLPLYVAVIEWEPVINDAVVNAACPAEFSVTVAIIVPLSLNVTVPVGTPAEEVTVAVNVTDCPEADGLTDELSAVVLDAPPTVCASAAEVLWANVSDPLYVAVMVCEPAASEAVDRLADPALSRVAVPITLAPSLKATVPIGIPAVDATVAVKTIVCPTAAGLADEVSVVVVGLRLTTCVRAVETLARVPLSPP
jgi:hypothetical protein